MAVRRQQDYGREFAFKNVQILVNEKLGSGSYGAVYKAKCDELICAAKKIFPVLFQQDPPEPGREHAHPVQRFESECHFLESINHPNIVQYLGVHRESRTDETVLFMELMDESLTHFLESSLGDLPYHTQVNLSYDIAQALAFLHSNGIIHRDLSSNNVLLLASTRAKVTDFGMSRLLGANRDHMTKCPGTPVFMPPEALEEQPVYSEKIDNFSFGVLIVQIITRQYPKPTDRYVEINIANPQYPSRPVRSLVPETERRKNHINLIPHTHPLLPVATNCLNDNETKRPTSQELCHHLDAQKESPKYADSAQEDVRNLIQTKNERILAQNQEIQAKDELLREKNEQIQEKDEQIQERENEVQNRNDQIQIKEQDLVVKISQLQEEEEIIDQHKDLLKATEAQVEKLTQDLNEVRVECEDRTRQLKELSQQVQRYEEEIEHFRQINFTHNPPQEATQCPMSSQLTLEIESITDKPESYNDKISIVNNKVYLLYKYREISKIYVHDINTRKWSEITAKPPVSKGFTIVNVDNILTIVGGEGTIWNSNKLYSYMYQYNKWLEIFPPMTNRWAYPEAASNKQRLIVSNDKEFQILNINTLQWSDVARFPFWPDYIVTICDYMYIYDIDSFSCGLITDNDITWEERTPAPLYRAGYLTNFSDHLLAIGGQERHENEEYEYFDRYEYNDVQDIYEYIPSEDKWKVIGQMSKPRSHCLAGALPNNKLIIIDNESVDLMSTSSVKTS